MPERSELGYPFAPTLYGRRKHTRVVVEVMGKVDEGRIGEWVAYGRSAGQDFRVTAAVPSGGMLSPADEDFLRQRGVGCLVVDGDSVVERLAAGDLALQVRLPRLEGLPKKVRAALSPAYEQFEAGLWREGFEAACQAFEAEARKYLKRHANSGRLVFVGRSGPRSRSGREIDRMTMGQLAAAFGEIQNRNKADEVIDKTLRSVGRDRNNVVHHKQRKATENRLRKNVGKHMWSLVAAMKYVVM